jgi:hypothetical protein
MLIEWELVYIIPVHNFNTKINVMCEHSNNLLLHMKWNFKSELQILRLAIFLKNQRNINYKEKVHSCHL